ncbi:MAG: ABC transporter substrate-binding protein [Elainellaceae cyanobacterium]
MVNIFRAVTDCAFGRRLHKRLAPAAIALSAVLAGACQAPSQLFVDQPLQTGEPLKIGVLVPDGDYSTISLPIIDAMLLMRDTVNACGGVNQAPVSLAFYDYDADRRTEAMGLKHLVNDVGVHGVVAMLSDPVSLNTLAIALDQNVGVVSPNATTTVQAKRRSALRGWGQLSLSEAQQGRALARLAIAQGWQRANLLTSDTEPGLRFAQTFIRAFEALGGTVVNRNRLARYPSDQPAGSGRSGPFLATPAPTKAQRTVLDAPAIEALTRDLTRDVDVLVASLDGRRGYRLLRSVIEQNSGDRPILLTHSAALPAFGEGRWQRINADNPYVFSGAQGLMPAVNTDILQALRARWQSAETLQWGEYAPQAWDAAALLVLAAEAAGRNWRAGLQAKLKPVANPPGVRVTQICEGLAHLRKGVMINYQGASGAVDLGTDGQLAATAQYRRWQISNSGKIRWGDNVTLK